MRQNRTFWRGLALRCSLLAGFLALASGWCHAAPPWIDLLTGKKIEADASKDYQLTEENGPWLIFACSFSGDGAEAQAHDLVLELRRRYKLPAYVHEMEFELDDTDGRGLNRYGGPVRMRYRRGDEIREVAVLVGDYAAVDDPEAQRTLERIKHYRPDSLKLDESRPTTRTLAAWRLLTSLGEQGDERPGPMSKAFVTTNPLLPREFFAPGGVDPDVVEWNEPVKYSLLDCPGPYSVQVATFKGRVLIKQDKIAAIESGREEMKSSLDEAADKAHRLTVALRMKGYEAYEFHDRKASIVCVGSFKSVGSPRQDGKTEINPKIHWLMKKFGAQPVNVPGRAPMMEPKTLVGIPFDIQPLPVKVPKPSISSALNRETAWR